SLKHKIMKLELKHLAPYLPYKLKFKRQDYIYIHMLLGISFEDIIFELGKTPIKFIKPILRPISDLNSEIELNGRKFYPIDELAEIDEVVVLQYSFEFFETSMKYLPHWIVEQLLEWHFDVFGLIEKGLAISIHDVEQADA
ncbi:TPA: hypothetical protein ACGFUY_002743, partial [Flavobacterium psychrophilum]